MKKYVTASAFSLAAYAITILIMVATSIHGWNEAFFCASGSGIGMGLGFILGDLFPKFKKDK
ncbi:MAG: hypothetical protein WCP55_08070 [Lentisphaerota bacterium]